MNQRGMVDIYKVYDGNFMQNPPSHQFKIWTLAWRRDGGMEGAMWWCLGACARALGLRSLARCAIPPPETFRMNLARTSGFLDVRDSWKG